MVSICEKYVQDGSARIWSEAFGSVQQPTVLLIMGAGCQGIVWPESFCEGLAWLGFHVIRYDHRDTGKSSITDSSCSYDLNDLADDAMSVLHAHGVEQAHVVGLSMGGFIAQLMAMGSGKRDAVRTLTLISTSPDQLVYTSAVKGEGYPDSELAGPSANVLDYVHRTMARPPQTKQEFMANSMDAWRVTAGDGIPLGEEEAHRLVTRVYYRARDLSATANHFKAMDASAARLDRLKEIAVPTLVVHGARDPVLPIDHGEALAKGIPNAKLEVIEEMGHAFPASLFFRMLPRLLEHLRTP